jgi:hypothetical protein
MTLTVLLDAIKKHGALGVLAAWLFYTNQRLTDVERELYRCYDKFQVSTDLKTRTPEKTIYFAVLPKEFEIKRKRG